MPEEEVFFSSGEVLLAGTLSLPGAHGRHPAAVLVAGSGARNRDEEVFGFRPFRLLADHLASEGIATLRYDGRGIGGSSGNPAEATIEDLADDVLAAVDLLRGRPEIDAGRIGVCGHSEGGLIAVSAASRAQSLSFLVLMASPGVSGDRVVSDQIERIARAEGAAGEVISQLLEAQQKAFRAIRTGAGWDELVEQALRAARDRLAALPDEQREAIIDPEGYVRQIVEVQLTRAGSVWFRHFIDHDPATGLREVACPVLALFGGRDLQVTVDLNKSAVVAALDQGATRDFTIRVFPEANHLFQQAETGLPSEYPGLAKEFAPGLLAQVAGWLRVHAFPP
jgi:uncharacterized protein